MNFEKYVNNIKDETIKSKTKVAVDNLPDYFWTMPSSTSGKYHPKFALGEGGLFRHVSFAVEIALELFNITSLTDIQKDVIISALLLHDGLKKGLKESRHSVKEHDDIMADWLEELWSENFTGRKLIIEGVRSHMGQWATTRKPVSKTDKFIHSCDYLASRKLYDKYYNK